MRARTSATIRPARRMRVDLARRLAGDHWPPADAGVLERLEQGRRDVLDRAQAIDRRQDAPRAVVVGDVVQRPELLLHPGPHGGLRIVGPMDELRAVDVAHAPDLRAA